MTDKWKAAFQLALTEEYPLRKHILVSREQFPKHPTKPRQGTSGSYTFQHV